MQMLLKKNQNHMLYWNNVDFGLRHFHMYDTVFPLNNKNATYKMKINMQALFTVQYRTKNRASSFLFLFSAITHVSRHSNHI